MAEDLEKKLWDETAAMLGNRQVPLGGHWTFNFRNDPKRLGFVLSRYKFSAKMACKNGTVLELGCSSGIGASILAENATSYTGIDLDVDAINDAKKIFTSPLFSFIYDDFMGKKYGDFDAVVSLDVCEHIHPEHEDEYFQTIVKNLSENGICIVGTPNITAAAYASEMSNLGHVNLFSQKRLSETLKKYFHQVFSFGMNDEMMHTGYGNMAHYLLAIGCHKKQG